MAFHGRFFACGEIALAALPALVGGRLRATCYGEQTKSGEGLGMPVQDNRAVGNSRLAHRDVSSVS